MNETESAALPQIRQPGKLLEQDIAGMAYTAHRRAARLCTGARLPKWIDVDPETFHDWCGRVAAARRGSRGARPVNIAAALVAVLKPHLH